MRSEKDDAILLAHRVLDTPTRDPDDDLSVLSRQFLAALETRWRTIDTAPKDGTPIDLWAKWWHAHTDTFLGRRVPDCKWAERSGHARWTSDSPIPSNSRFTHWTPTPDPPIGAVDADPNARGEQ
jgi:hypothetical protein